MVHDGASGRNAFALFNSKASAAFGNAIAYKQGGERTQNLKSRSQLY
jgi:hypothetical protein